MIWLLTILAVLCLLALAGNPSSPEIRPGASGPDQCAFGSRLRPCRAILWPYFRKTILRMLQKVWHLTLEAKDLMPRDDQAQSMTRRNA